MRLLSFSLSIFLYALPISSIFAMNVDHNTCVNSYHSISDQNNKDEGSQKLEQVFVRMNSENVENSKNQKYQNGSFDHCFRLNHFTPVADNNPSFIGLFEERNKFSDSSGRIIFGEDLNEKKNFHAKNMFEIFSQLSKNIHIVFTNDSKTLNRYNAKIINMSFGSSCFELDNPNIKFFFEYISKMNLDESKIFIKKFAEKELSDVELKQINLKYEDIDTYILEKYFDEISGFLSEKTDNDTVYNKFCKYIDDEGNDYLLKMNNLLKSHQYLIVQSLSNDFIKQRFLSYETCDFKNLNEDFKSKNHIIFARNLYFKENEDFKFFTPDSQIPGSEFADRTLCAFTPIEEFWIRFPELYRTSNNSASAPWISTASNILYQKMEQNMIKPKIAVIAKILLDTADRIYMKDEPEDKILINGNLYSKTYGAGVINLDKALNSIIKFN